MDQGFDPGPFFLRIYESLENVIDFLRVIRNHFVGAEETADHCFARDRPAPWSRRFEGVGF
jgi:hypothetical protein